MNRSTRTPSRLVLTIAFTITALLLGIIGAVAAGTGTVTPPPKIAFVTTNADIAPDALTVGPMAGRLGAPLFITDKHNLGEDTKNALVAYGPQLIIIAGGPNTVTDAVLGQISAATGLTIEQFDDKPDSGIIRAFGAGRDQTAAKLSELIANYNPKFLPTDATAVGAVDADTLDGKDAGMFMQTTIPSGTTVYGTIGAQYLVPVTGEVGATASLPGVAPVALDSDHIAVVGVDGDGTQCPGSSSAPSAAPGYVCIYPYSVGQATIDGGYVWGPATSNRYGFQISWLATVADSHTFVFANWAYTAP